MCVTKAARLVRSAKLS